MARSVNDPLLKHDLPARVTMHDAAVGAAPHPTPLDCCSQIDVQCFPELRGDLIAVIWIYCRVLVPMKNNCRDHPRSRSSIRVAPRPKLVLAHSCKGGSNVTRGAAGEARMHPNCGVEVGVGCRQNRRGRAAGREPGSVNPVPPRLSNRS
jgi:hypothetical protein